MQGEILYEEKLKLLPDVEIGPVPEGMRIDSHYSGHLSGLSIHGKVDGVDYVLLRPDGVLVLHVHAVITTDGGDRISVEGSGFGTATPDGRFAMKGALNYKTGSKELAWLNSTQGIVDGFVDLNAREVNAKIFKL